MSKKTAKAGMTSVLLAKPDERLCQLLGLRSGGLAELLGKLRLATVGAPPTLCDYCRQQVEHLALRYNCVALLVDTDPAAHAARGQSAKVITPHEHRLADDRRRLAAQIDRQQDERKSLLAREGLDQQLAKSDRSL